jgi:DNA invertase Pin-like site-specific DNA recombinase
MVAQMERRFIKERQREGIARAKAAGVYLGGKRRINRQEIAALAKEGVRPTAIAKIVGCSRIQVYRVMHEAANLQGADV